MFERKEKKNWAVSQIGNSNECLPPDFQSPKLMECVLFHQLFIMLVVLHGGWLAKRWPPVWLPEPRISVRSALKICIMLLGYFS